MSLFHVLLIGDVNGKPGRKAIASIVPKLKIRFGDLKFIIANGENAAAGFGITESVFSQLLESGIDVVTMGNHTWDNKAILSFINREPRLIRPANYPEGVPGIGFGVYEVKNSLLKVGVVNLMGRTFMNANLDCPFKKIDALLPVLRARGADLIFVDFHAETTSDKCAMGWFLDGRVSCVFGTHTHIQTNDARILKEKTAYVTDLGMTGGHDGVIGVTLPSVIPRYLTGMPTRFEVCDENIMLHGAVVSLDEDTRQVVKIELIKEYC